jgi:hypothetical protein
MWLAIDTPPKIDPVTAAARPLTEVYYGGPDQAPGALRDILKARVDAAPAGSEIIWATYYFRDRDLAESLIAAHRRGVRVRVRIEASPRSAGANRAVVNLLRTELGEDVRLQRAWFGLAHLHTKIYAFSGPQPEALIGSFNPSGDETPDPGMVAEIGDQDRGQNLLVAFREPGVARSLQRQAERIWKGKGVSRFDTRMNRPRRFADTRLFYFPRLRPDVVDRRIARLGPGDRVQAAISHMDQGPFARQLAEAAERGVQIDLVVHDTARRVPKGVVRDLGRAGVNIQRYCDAEGLPMHAKFVVIQDSGKRSAWFGSFNYTVTSRYLNQEVLARSTNAQVVDDLEARFQTLSDEAARKASACLGTAQARTASADR